MTRVIRSRRIGVPRFRLPFKAEDAYRLLLSCYVAEVERREKKFIDHPDTLDRIWELAQFLTQEHPKLGVLMCGKVGNGKTTLLYAFQTALNFLRDKGINNLGLNSKDLGIRIISAKDIMQIAKTDWKRYENIRDYPMLGLDELGAEPKEVKDYGDIVTAVVDLIEHRYVAQKFTLITSNLDPEEIKKRYEERVADRLREMVDYIIFGDMESYRRRLK